MAGLCLISLHAQSGCGSNASSATYQDYENRSASPSAGLYDMIPASVPVNVGSTACVRHPKVGR